MKRTDRKYFCLPLALLFALSSCDEKVETAQLYNIDSLISSQVEYLNATGARLSKSAFIASQQDDSVYQPKDSAAWRSELDIFNELNAINKPINRSSYIVDDNLFDPSSNLTVKAISAIEDLPVKYVRIFYQESIHQPRKIEALYDDRNALYKSGRLLEMRFHQINNKSILTSYSIQGGQQVIMGDSVGFTIRGKIIIE